ncbi:MAG: hypothetical protein P857_590 [Candidatus Xenolissoclinum pacificiensis L6]|uniref:Uncharacterized protein n=1 Tax=Candidatus Xenolissoclinum pacificiensis L6 TaxID=1401685 RepID=W2UYU7_9RICK|nr:MAG: hypothetical protein P857_590 [Candidatus Xenolissoclinum pacificiensis L6]
MIKGVLYRYLNPIGSVKIFKHQNLPPQELKVPVDSSGYA